MTTAVEFIGAISAYLGAVETPPGSNHVPGITDWYGFDGPWCDMLISKAADDCGLDHDRCAWVPSEVDRAAAGYKGYRLVEPSDLAPGDWIAHNLPGGIEFDHIDAVAGRDGDELSCVDGNWGDRCMRVLRSVGDDSIQAGACIRPPYTSDAPAPTPAPPDPPIVQEDVVMADVLGLFEWIGVDSPDHDSVRFWVEYRQTHTALQTYDAFVAKARTDGHKVP